MYKRQAAPLRRPLNFLGIDPFAGRADEDELDVYKRQQSFLALTALGVVFGDIGTSPLYTFSTALTATGHAPSAAEVLGVVSLTFWALMILISVKYVTFVLRADNEGEGGILALLSLVERPRETVERVKLSFVVLLGVIGAALLYGDGVITPAISVLSAIEGLKFFSPSVADFVVPVTLVILIGLFALQYRGTGSVGRLFGPVMVVWFVVIGILGLVNIIAAPEILEAFNPLEAVRFAVASPFTLFVVLGGVFLALTGGEALYADMGHVGRTAIRQAWFGLVLPALVLCYFGQGARVLAYPQAIENPFYSLAPSWAVVPLVVLAALATVIASQALISGVFSMTRQAIQMGLCPRTKIIPTSSDEVGQVYLPTANWLLMVGTLLVVLMFKTSDALASAYGIAVSGTMLATTILLYHVAVARWKWPPVVAGAAIAFIGGIEASNADDPKTVIAKMRETPVNDAFTPNGRLRPDGRMVHDVYLVQIKSPAESKGEWDLLKLVATIRGDEVFRPMADGGCPAIAN